MFFVRSEMFFFQFKRELIKRCFSYVWFYTFNTKRWVIHLHTHLLKLIECVFIPYRMLQIQRQSLALNTHVKVFVGFPGSLHFYLNERRSLLWLLLVNVRFSGSSTLLLFTGMRLITVNLFLLHDRILRFLWFLRWKSRSNGFSLKVIGKCFLVSFPHAKVCPVRNIRLKFTSAHCKRVTTKLNGKHFELVECVVIDPIVYSKTHLFSTDFLITCWPAVIHRFL
jgi:hypothetical protein